MTVKRLAVRIIVVQNGESPAVDLNLQANETPYDVSGGFLEAPSKIDICFPRHILIEQNGHFLKRVLAHTCAITPDKQAETVCATGGRRLSPPITSAVPRADAFPMRRKAREGVPRPCAQGNSSSRPPRGSIEL
jgi:hypothetical protein